MSQRFFPLDEIFSITTGRLLATRQMDAIYDIMSFLTNSPIFTHQIPRASQPCRRAILVQHPCLDTAEMHTQEAWLQEALSELPLTDAAHAKRLITEWVLAQEARLGCQGFLLDNSQDLGEYNTPLADAIKLMDGDPDRVTIAVFPRQEP